MRVRPVPLLLAIFGSAAATAIFVVRQFPREGEVSPPSHAPDAAAPAETSPALDPPATAADGVVEVRVTAGGEPQANADVRLYRAPEGVGAPWRRAGQGSTGADGVARLHARPGAYLVAARVRGLAPGRAEVVRPSGGEVARAFVALEPPAALEGRVTLRSGGPAERARVRAVPIVSRPVGLDPPSAPPEETAEVGTDGQGAFRIAGLSPGTWAVSVDAAGHHPVLVPRAAVPGDAIDVALEPLGFARGRVLHPDGRPGADALVRATSSSHAATARSDGDGRFEIAAPAGRYVLSASLGDLAGAAGRPVEVAPGAKAQDAEVRLGPAATLDGAVALPGGAPAAGARLALFPHEARDVVARAVAGRDGRFEVRGLAPGAYDVLAAASSASPAWIPGVTLAPGARFPLRIALVATGAIEGTIVAPGGRALAGVAVRAVVRDGFAASPPAETRTDFEGRFRLDGVEVGRAEVVARQENVDLGVSAAVRVAPGRASRLDLVLPEAGVLAGRVSAAGRAPPPGTTVVAVGMGAGPGTLQVARAAADASGNYQLALPAGEYRVHAAPRGAAPSELRTAPAFARVERGRSSLLPLSLAPAAREGEVEILVLEPGGTPSSGALVTLARPDDDRIALAAAAGEDGRLVVGGRMGMVGERVTIRARNGGRTGAETLALPAAGSVQIRLAPGGAVDGVVRGARAESFTVEVSSQPAAGSWRTLDVHRFVGGRFELADLPSEPLRLTVRTDDGRRGGAEVRLAPGERRSVEIALR